MDLQPCNNDGSFDQEHYPSSRGRIIYVRDFGGIAKLAEPLIRALITVTRLRRIALMKASTPGGIFLDTEPSVEDNQSTGVDNLHLLQRTTIVLGISGSFDWSDKTSYRRLGEAMQAYDCNQLSAFLPHIRTWKVSKPKEEDLAKSMATLLVNPTLDPPIKNTDWPSDQSLCNTNVYRRIICLYGLQDTKQSAPEEATSFSSQSSNGKKRMNSKDELWIQERTIFQMDRKREIEAACLTTGEEKMVYKREIEVECLAINEQKIQREITALGGIVILSPNHRIFASLQSSRKSVETSANSLEKQHTNTSEETLLREFGVFTNVLSTPVTKRIAKFACFASSYDPSTSNNDTPLHSSSHPPKYTVTPEHIISAFKASASRESSVRDLIAQAFKGEGKNGNSRSTKNVVTDLRDGDSLDKHETALISNVIDPKQLKISFKDVCLDPAIIDNVRTTISFPLRYPKAFSMGILESESMSGILLYGPPGTGKTMLCRAIAKECKANMLAISPSDVKNMWLGESEKLCKAIFTLARKLAPCIVFIDEVDAILGARTSQSTSSSTHTSMVRTLFPNYESSRKGFLIPIAAIV